MKLFKFKAENGLCYALNPRYVIGIQSSLIKGKPCAYVMWAEYTGDFDGASGTLETASVRVDEPCYDVLIELWESLAT